MLNELFALTRSLKAAGIGTNPGHDHFLACPKRFTVRLILDGTPDVVRMEDVDAEEAALVRKYEISAGTSFPAFNVLPLYRARHQGLKDDDRYRELRKALKAAKAFADMGAARSALGVIIAQCEPLWTGKEAKRIGNCLVSQSQALLNIVGTPPKDFASFAELVQRAKGLAVQTLQKRLQDLVVEEMVNNPTRAVVWLDALLVATADSLDKVKKASVILEVSDGIPYPANHPRVQDWINARLMATGAAPATTTAPAGTDAFGGSLEGTAGKLPKVRLSVVGDVKLRAMSGEIPCQFRYGRVGEHGFPIGKLMRQDMKNSLRWLGAKERKGQTWEDARGLCGLRRQGGKQVPVAGVLFVHPETLNDNPPELAGMFVRGEQQKDGKPDTPDEGKFEAAAGRATAALQAIVKQHPECALRVFVLAKPDGFHTKVLFSRRYDAQALISSAEQWRKACRDMPRVALNIGTEKAPAWVRPLTPFPVEVVECLSLAWLQNGSRVAKTHGLAAGDGIALLLEARHGLAERALRLALVNTTPLLLAVGHADHRRDGRAFSWSGKTGRYARHARLLPSILALLLRKLGHEKGGYMHTAPFLVGRMLALADTLHMEYCRHVRKNQVPPQLLGNALMVQALDSPMLGLARLSDRIAVYHAWARTATGDGVGLAKWALGQMGKVADELGALAVPDRADDAAKAHMLLGYLARPERAAAEDSDKGEDAVDGAPTEHADEAKR